MIGNRDRLFNRPHQRLYIRLPGLSRERERARHSGRDAVSGRARTVSDYCLFIREDYPSASSVAAPTYRNDGNPLAIFCTLPPERFHAGGGSATVRRVRVAVYL